MDRFRSARLFLPIVSLSVFLTAAAQQEKHGRGYKAPPPTAPVVITVEKAFNGQPMPNASVIFRAIRDEVKDGNMEMKTDPNGHASMLDLLEVGSHVTVQVIAAGYATYASDFDLTAEGKQLVVKMQRPRAQISTYGDNQDRPAVIQPGVQEHRPDAGKPQGAPPSIPPSPVSPTSPLQTTHPVNSPATLPAGPNSALPGTPQ